MERTYLEEISTTNGKFYIYEIGESVFWEIYYHTSKKARLFHSLISARDFIRDTEVTDSWDELFDEYVSRNLAVN